MPDPTLLVTGEDAEDFAGRRIVFANAAARAILPIARERPLLVAAIRHPDVLEAIDESLFGGLERELTYEVGGGAGQVWRVWSKPLPDIGRARAALVVMRDETDVRRNERMRADFLANASHELRTPLASLAGFIETLRGHAREDVAVRGRFLAIMARQADRMARLIDDLLSLSRIELNEHIRPSGSCDLAQAATDVADALAPQIEARQVKLALRLPPRGMAAVTGERDQIVQVIQNLLDNAVKYSSPGGVVDVDLGLGLAPDAAAAFRAEPRRLADPEGGRMSLLTPAWSASDRYAALRVSDRGPGISREHLPRLAERFYRVEGGKTAERTGTGLGLAIVKHIVNRHRGGLSVESAPGQGAAFCVYLPMAPETGLRSSMPVESSRAIEPARPAIPAETKLS